LEQDVLDVLATAGEPLTPARVRAALADRLAYTTVMTVLGRLAGKGLATRSRVGRAFAYQAVPNEAEVTARQMRRLLEAGDDRAAVLSQFVKVLAPEDEAVLAGLIHREEKSR
jgi:predicted transcriptional regulator